MIWVTILLGVVVVALVAMGAVLVVLVRRGQLAPAQPDPAVNSEMQARLTTALEERDLQAQRHDQLRTELEARVRELEADLARREERLGAAERRVAEVDTELARRTDQSEQAGVDARLLHDEAERKLAEAAAQRAATDDHARQERADLRELRGQLDARELRIGEREERLVAESQALETRSSQLVELRAEAQRIRDDLALEREELARERQEHGERVQQELGRVAGLDRDQAHAEVMSRVEHESRLEATSLARDIEQTAVREADARARGIIVTAIQRLASEQTSESVVSTLDLPSDEMKGRIIGREGRNIRHFEQVTGVNVMVDDTPGSVLLSCFDPVRREVARVTLEELVTDGRIHPARIEEVYERSRARIEQRMMRAAEDALAEVGISDLDPALIPVVGALRYRTSYGQNVLRHLVECAHIAGMMAAELGLDVATCKRAAFLHDIGKALTHEVEGTHAMVGADLARRHGESADIVHAIEAHHNEVEPTTVEAVLTQAADAISGSRPGARRESLEAYIQRLDRLEQIAASHEGVDKVFAMQAGREIRVMVSPDQVDDITSQSMARAIAREVEAELTYPGQIRVTVVRESRATEVAH